MFRYTTLRKYEAVLAHCQSSANSELYRNAEDYGKAAGFFDSSNNLTQEGSALAHILLVDEIRTNRIAA